MSQEVATPEPVLSGPAPSRRFEHLDGLRGVSALVVVFAHFVFFLSMTEPGGGPITGWVKQTPIKALLNGDFAVYIFFVLSGFVLAQSVARGGVTLFARIVARYFRLTVPMLASLIFAWALFSIFPQVRTEFVTAYPNEWMEKHFYGSDFPGFFKTVADGLYGVYLHGTSLFNNVVWTMRKELMGSILIYLVYRFTSPGKIVPVLVLLGTVLLFYPILLGFPLGALLREAWVRGGLRDRPWAWATFAFGLWIANDGHVRLWPTASPETVPPSSFIFDHMGHTYSLGAALLLFSVLTLPALRGFFSHAIPRFLGRISFSLYLVHVPLLGTFFTWLALHLTLAPYLKLGTLLVLFLPTSFAVAWLMTVALDEPLMLSLRHLKNLRLPTWK